MTNWHFRECPKETDTYNVLANDLLDRVGSANLLLSRRIQLLGAHLKGAFGSERGVFGAQVTCLAVGRGVETEHSRVLCEVFDNDAWA